MRYSDSHEWAHVEGEIATIGITDFAQKELGEVVFVQLPRIGQSLKAGSEAVVLESTKAAADIYTPLSGVVVEVNPSLSQQPELINSSPQEKGWLFKMKSLQDSEYKSLMDEDAYKRFIAE